MSVPHVLCCTFVLIFETQSKELNKNKGEQIGTEITNLLK